MCYHERPPTPKRPAGFSFIFAQIWEIFLQNRCNHSIQRPSMYKTQKDHQQRSHHTPPQTPNNPRPSPSNLCKSAHDFRKLTILWSSTALDRQSPKISGPNVKPRASTCLRQHWHSKPPVHALPRTSNLLRVDVDIRDREMTSWMTSSSTTPVWPVRLDDPVWPGPTHKSDPVRTACKKRKKKKRKEKEKMLWPSGPLTLTKKSKF